MKILFISTMAGASWGGSEELWVRTAEYALAKEYEVIISIYDWGSLNIKIQALKEKGAKIVLRQKIFFGNSVTQRIKGFLIKKIIAGNEIVRLNKYKPDVIVISQGTIFECMSTEFLSLLDSTSAKSAIITQANSEYDTLSSSCFKVGKELFKKATKLYFVSKRNELVAERQLALKFNNSVIVSNPSNINKDQICKWNDSKTLNFAFVGRLDSTIKGLGVLFQILGEEIWKGRDWQLNLYGAGQDEIYLKELVSFYDLEKKVFFNGYVNDIEKIWEHNHVLLMPSTLEGTPLSLIEAMLCGRTAVVSDVGGNAELIENEINGFVSEAPSVNSFGIAMERMWNKKDELIKLGAIANESIKGKMNFNSAEIILESISQF